MDYIFLVLLVAMTLATSRWIATKAAITVLFIVLFAFWYISDMFTGYGVTDAVYYHIFNTAEGSSIDDLYSKFEIGALFIFAIVIFLVVSITFKVKNINLVKVRHVNALWLITLICTLFTPYFSNIYNSAKDTFFNKGDAAAVQNEYKPISGALNKKYNYVFIYAESLEHTLRNLDGENHLPELSKIASQYLDFTDIRQPISRGMGWTMAGMVNTQCGIPLVMEQGNSGANFENFLGKADCVASWLKQQGYQTEFIRGSQKEFAGGDKFLEQHGWQSQHDKSWFVDNHLAAPDQISGWGIHDDVMLDHAWNEFSRMSQSQQPFLLSFLTVNTHAPSGTFLPVCDKHVAKNDQYPMLASVSCSDYLLSNFIQRITDSQWFDNTIIVLVSDHLMMSNDASSLLSANEKSRRNQFIIIKKGIKPEKNHTTGTLLDVWPTVLDLSGSTVKEIGFGSSLLEHKPGRFIKNYALGRTKDYLAYAAQLWNYPSINDGLKQTDSGIQIGDQRYSLPVFSNITNSGKLKAVWFEAFAINARKLLLNKEDLFYANTCQNIGIDEPGLCAYIVSEHSIKQLRVNEEGISATKVSDKPPVFYQNDILGLSSSPFTMMSGGRIDNHDVGLAYGFNFISINNGIPDSTLSYPTCSNPTLPVDEIKTYLNSQTNPVIFASNDSAVCADVTPLNQLSEVLHQPEMSSLQFRQQIIGVYKDGKSEFIKGIPGLPLDAFVDTKDYKIISLCKAFADCQ